MRQVCRTVTRPRYFHARCLGNRLLTSCFRRIVSEPNSALGKHLNKLFQRKATLRILVLAALAEIGITISLATGLVIAWPTLPGLLGPTCTQLGAYGFPIAWRQLSCGSSRLELNWYGFWLNVIFYMAAGHVVVSVREVGRESRAGTPPVGFLLAVTFTVLVMAFVAWAMMSYSTTLFGVGVLVRFLLPLLSLVMWTLTVVGVSFPDRARPSGV